jgi:hypothetical protein
LKSKINVDISGVEIAKFKWVLVCIYRSHSDVNIFMKKLKLLIDRIQKKLIICGDWNINLLHKNDQVQTLKNILVSYDLINLVTSPTIVTCSSESLLDMMVVNRLMTAISRVPV